MYMYVHMYRCAVSIHVACLKSRITAMYLGIDFLSDGRWDVHLEIIDEGNNQLYGVTSNRYVDGSKCSIDIAYSMVPKFGNGIKIR